jgi:hypothetical protein
MGSVRPGAPMGLNWIDGQEPEPEKKENAVKSGISNTTKVLLALVAAGIGLVALHYACTGKFRSYESEVRQAEQAAAGEKAAMEKAAMAEEKVTVVVEDDGGLSAFDILMLSYYMRGGYGYGMGWCDLFQPTYYGPRSGFSPVMAPPQAPPRGYGFSPLAPQPTRYVTRTIPRPPQAPKASGSPKAAAGKAPQATRANRPAQAPPRVKAQSPPAPKAAAPRAAQPTRSNNPSPSRSYSAPSRSYGGGGRR